MIFNVSSFNSLLLRIFILYMVINNNAVTYKKRVKYNSSRFTLRFTALLSFNVFGTVSNTSIFSSHVVAKSSTKLLKHLLISQSYKLRFQTKCSWHTRCLTGFLHSQRLLSLLHFWFELYFLLSSLHLRSHEICFLNVF